PDVILWAAAPPPAVAAVRRPLPPTAPAPRSAVYRSCRAALQFAGRAAPRQDQSLTSIRRGKRSSRQLWGVSQSPDQSPPALPRGRPVRAPPDPRPTTPPLSVARRE